MLPLDGTLQKHLTYVRTHHLLLRELCVYVGPERASKKLGARPYVQRHISQTVKKKKIGRRVQEIDQEGAS